MQGIYNRYQGQRDIGGRKVPGTNYRKQNQSIVLFMEIAIVAHELIAQENNV